MTEMDRVRAGRKALEKQIGKRKRIQEENAEIAKLKKIEIPVEHLSVYQTSPKLWEREALCGEA